MTHNIHQMERDVFRDVCSALVNQGYYLNVYFDGEAKPEFKRPGINDADKLADFCFDGIYASTDEWSVIVSSSTGDEHIGTFKCVAGNEGYNLIADNSLSLEHIIGPIIEKWEDVYNAMPF